MDNRRRIVSAAADELARAGVDELFAFLTPVLLAEGPERPWSPGTVRYQFRRDGLGFDREALVAVLAATLREDIQQQLDRWATATETDLARGADATATLATSLQALIDALDGRTLRALQLARLAGVGDDPTAPFAAPLRRVLDAYSHAAYGVAPDAETLGGLACSVGARLVLGGASAAALVQPVAAALEPAGAPRSRERAPAERYEDVVLRLERQLDAVDPGSPAALTLLEQLAQLAPTGDWIFIRVRDRLERILDLPGLRDSKAGRPVWSAAAATVAMAAGDRELADEAATAALTAQPLRAESASLYAGIRTGWLLMRLERLEESRDQLARVSRMAARGGFDELAALADAFAALELSLSGPLDAVTEVDDRGGQEGMFPLARAITATATARALLLWGDHAAAERVLDDPRHAGVPASLGTNMMQLYRGWVLLAQGRHADAHVTLTTLRERLARIAAANPSGWPWLEPSVAALTGLGRVAEAQALIVAGEPAAQRWGTPVVLAEVERARALVAAGDAERRAALRRAQELLASSPAVVEAERAEIASALAEERPAHEGVAGVGWHSILVAVHASAHGPLEAMSGRVREVADLVAAGVPNQEIAAQLGISASTVSRHVSRALSATGTRNRTELAALLTRSRS